MGHRQLTEQGLQEGVALLEVRLLSGASQGDFAMMARTVAMYQTGIP
jgi:hypothetical protein